MRPAILVVLALGLGLTAKAQTSLTIYNEDFAIIRDTLKLDLHEGVNEVRYPDVAIYAEPSSVILRDPTGKVNLQILEQSFRGASVTQETTLSMFEGQTIDFLRYDDGKSHLVTGKIIRSGRSKTSAESEGNVQKVSAIQPIIEVNGKTQFELPGTPLFPRPAEDKTIKPEFVWKISTPTAVQAAAEIAYTAYAIHWFADYNLITSEDSDVAQMSGWMTIDNETGKSFENARVKFVAGMLYKMNPRAKPLAPAGTSDTERVIVTGSDIPNRAKTLDEYYVYTHPVPLSLKDRETKQVQFLNAEGMQAKKIYVYGGAVNEIRATGSGPDLNPDVGVESQTKIEVSREFKNTASNHLGIPLPRGRMRFFRRSEDHELEFIGEYDADATAVDEVVKASTGYAFDLVAERKRPSFEVDLAKRTATESFEIKIRNHKKEAVEVRVVEKLGRWNTWEITVKSDSFTKTDSSTVEFNVPVKAEEERKVNYTVVYSKLPIKPEGN